MDEQNIQHETQNDTSSMPQMDIVPMTHDTAQNMVNMKSWMTFIGIFSIIVGGLYSLMIVYAPFGIPLIFMGLKLTNAGKNFEALAASGNPIEFAKAISNLKSYFLISGILIIVSLGIVVIALIVLVIVLIVKGPQIFY